MTDSIILPRRNITTLNETLIPIKEHDHEAEEPEQYIVELDFFLASLHIFCFVFGSTGNITAFRYFASQRKELSTCIYLCISLTDIVISLLTLPVAISYIGHREPILFGMTGFCTFWGSINTVAPHLSVFMVAVLSMTRTHSLLFPLHKVRKRSILILMGLYFVVLSVQAGIPLALGMSKMIYLKDDTYCYSEGSGKVWRNVDTILDVIELGCPIIPVIFSCALSSFHILRSRSISNCRSSSRIKVNASITIIIFTLVYILFNIPVFIQFILYLVTLYKYNEYPGPLFSSLYMSAYSWNIVFVLCVALNATINPFIYFSRMRHFKRHVIDEMKSLKRFLFSKENYSRVRMSDENRQYVTSGVEMKTMIEGEVRLVRTRTQVSLASCADVDDITS